MDICSELLELFINVSAVQFCEIVYVISIKTVTESASKQVVGAFQAFNLHPFSNQNDIAQAMTSS